VKEFRILAVAVTLGATACSRPAPAPWSGPILTQPRTQLTVEQLNAAKSLPFVDLSFFSRPAWALDDAQPLSGTLSFAETPLTYPKERESSPGEDLFPAFSVAFASRDGRLFPQPWSLIDTRNSGSFWDVIVGVGAVWREPGDGEWSRASFPLNLIDRYIGQVRNCVGAFVYKTDAVSDVQVQCSQETTFLDAQLIGDIRALVPTTYARRDASGAARDPQDYGRIAARRFPVAPLNTIDRDGKIAKYFDQSIWTNASTSLGAVYLDGTLYVNPAKTRHGTYPYPQEMRHGVFSVTKSMAGALAMFYFAERYGDRIFDELVSNHVPAFANLAEWQGVTFSHTLNMATGTRAGEDLLYEPLELAPNKEIAISNIARFGDFPEAPGERYNYATTNTFVLSYALEDLVQKREGRDVGYWDLVREHVLKPLGAEDFHLLHTRDTQASDRIPILGLGGLPNLDNAAKIASLIYNEGVHQGKQLLSRNKTREALGHTEWRGYRIDSRQRYRHSFWSKQVRAGACTVDVVFMQGVGGNHVLMLPSGVMVFRFTEEMDYDFDSVVRAVEEIKSSCS
jgi:CubicO group peptidase (beta-lactamase class C family)